MPRRVFFSFHYEADVWRASQIRNSWLTKPDRQAAGFWDAAAWEQVKRQGTGAVERWIDRELQNTSVTAVLIGSQTADREYVQYEIKQSYLRGNGMLGIYIDLCKDRNGLTCSRGMNPFSLLYVNTPQGLTYLSSRYSTYDWIFNSGYNNFPAWVEAAARGVGR